MQKFTFQRQATGLFTDQQNQLAYNQDNLLEFIGHSFSKANFAHQLKAKKQNYSKENRAVLSKVLSNVYSGIQHSDSIKNNLEALKLDNTFTVTTGHQLSIFTGPIYLIYKIIHTIRVAEELSIEYPENNFVPVFWMASEDHDFEEIQTINLFNKNLSWETEQKGPVGRFDTDGLEDLKKEIRVFFENQSTSEIDSILNSYSGDSLGKANFNLIHKLFNGYGLIVIDGDQTELKSLFVPVIEKELTEQFSYNAVHKTNEQLLKKGMKLQVNAREVNLFYIENQVRERILHLDDAFFIEGYGKFSQEELLAEAKKCPERFSPNVVLRPVYQETILPNLCYVGGVGELTYWLQLKGVFEAMNLTFPLIQPRTSILWVDAVTSKKIDKASIVLEDLFLDIAQVKKEYLAEFASEDVDFIDLNRQLDELKSGLLEKINSIDVSLEKYALSETIKLDKQIEAIKDKLVKTVKQKHDSAMKSIEQVFERLFPNGGMQERSLNLFGLCSDGNVSSKIEYLHNSIDPFDPDFIIIRE